MGAGNLGHPTPLRTAPRPRPVHASGGSADRHFSGRVKRRTLARGRLFLEYAWPRIHPFVDGRGVLFPCPRRRLLFARSFFDRLGGLTFQVAPARDPRMDHMPPGQPMSVALPQASARGWLLRAIWVLAAGCAFLLILPYLLTPLYRMVDPVSTLMIWRWAKRAPVERVTVPIDLLPPALPRTVIAAEDARFCSHHGI